MISAGFYQVRRAGTRVRACDRPSPGHDARAIDGDSPGSDSDSSGAGETADVVIPDGGAADELAKRGIVRGSKIDLAKSQIGMVVRASRKAEYQQRRSVQENVARCSVDRLLGQRQRQLPLDDAVCEARCCRSGGTQESKSARTPVRRTSGCGRCARRSGNRFSTGQRAHTRCWRDLRRSASGGASAGILVLGAITTAARQPDAALALLLPRVA